jgi:HEAT repeat protein
LDVLSAGSEWGISTHDQELYFCSLAIESLIASMNDECAYVRRRVVTALAKVNRNDSIQLTEGLISALGDPDSKVRSAAAWSLRDFASFSTLAALSEAVRDHNKNVSWRAFEALQKIGIPAVKTLVELLEHPDSELRYRAAKTLGKIGGQRAIEALQKSLNDSNCRSRKRKLCSGVSYPN